LDKPLQRSGNKLVRRDVAGPKRLDKSGIHRAPLSFIEPAPNPLAGLDKSGTPEEALTAEQRALREGFIARSKAEAVRFSETLRTDYYFCVVFEHGDQAAHWLREVGYRNAQSQFIDGTVLAKEMGIDLPPTPFKLRKLRPADKSLRHLVTSIPKRSEIKRAPG
jgi:hypothetical protein